MVYEYQLRLLPHQCADELAIKQYVSRQKGHDLRTLSAVRILKRSIDARQRTIYVNLKVAVYVNELPTDTPYTPTIYPDVSQKPAVVVVGAGPGGLFAALKLIELGLRPIVVERGKCVEERRRDIARITKTQQVEPESNYSFGEGGAGAFSDGKLYTRSKKRGNVDKILHVLCQHGANSAILSDAHPHIGTDKLPTVIARIRATILQCGGEVHFNCRMDALLLLHNKVVGIATSNGKTFRGAVILATGHSARDVYRWLYNNHIDIEAKGLAIGVRLEHPSLLIDQIQYHSKQGRGNYLPAAEYSFVTQVEGRGVYSFCMCPGGFVVPAASGAEQLVVNGMSPANRGSKWSNSGMVVELHPEDLSLAALTEGLPPIDSSHPLGMLQLQEALERCCYLQGGMKQTAPAQRMEDFVKQKQSYDLPRTSYAPGVVSSALHEWLPPFVANRLRVAFELWGHTSKGFLTNQATMIAIETRTSSPVRIMRHNDTLQHCTVQGLFPCGEGAGYAGGIVSAAIDGERCAEAVAGYMGVKF